LRAEDLAGGDEDQQQGDKGLSEIELAAPLQKESKATAEEKEERAAKRDERVKWADEIDRAVKIISG